MKTEVRVKDKTSRNNYEKGDDGYIDGYIVSSSDIVCAIVVIREKTNVGGAIISTPSKIVAIPLGDLEVTGIFE